MFLQRGWSWVSDDWLVNKTASRLFGASAIVVVFLATPFFLGLFPTIRNAPMLSWANLLELVLGVVTPLAILFLWTGMWRHWTQCNTSTRAIKRVWFFVLLFGLWWGAVLYYLMAYLRHAEKTEPDPTQPQSKGRVTKTLGYILLIGWVGLFSFVALVFAFPKSVGSLLHPIADFFVLIPTFLLLGTAIYGIMRLYRAGMNRAQKEFCLECS